MPFSSYNSAELGITPWRLVVLMIAVLFRRTPPLLLLYRFVPEIHSWKEALFSGHFDKSVPLLAFRGRYDACMQDRSCRWVWAPCSCQPWHAHGSPPPRWFSWKSTADVCCYHRAHRVFCDPRFYLSPRSLHTILQCRQRVRKKRYHYVDQQPCYY